MCRLALKMSTEDYNGIAAEVRDHGTVLVEKPTNEALVALTYAYFDTRPSTLAEMNIMDLENSPFTRNKITRKTLAKAFLPFEAYFCCGACCPRADCK